MRIAATYHRASREKQTVEQQEEITKKFCEQQGIQIFNTYSEKISGAKDARPELDRMLKDMRDGKFNTVVVAKYDRLGRSTKHLLDVLDEFRNRNVTLIAVSQNIDTSTPMGKFFFTVIAGIGELEREMIVERTKDKLDYYKRQLQKKGYFINKRGKKCFSLGRPRGSKDSKRRKKGGYYLRYQMKGGTLENED